MALSRLRHPVISRPPSLFRARGLSASTRSLTRSSSLLNTVGGDGTLSRPGSLSALSGVQFKFSYPKASILAVGRGNKVVEPVIGSDGIERPGVVTKTNLMLSADHRVFDGKVGGTFLSALQSNFSDIRRLLL